MTEPSAPAARAPGLREVLRDTFSGKEHDFSTGSVKRAIPLLAIPMVLEMGMEALFAVCDVFFVAKLGSDAVATVGITESMMAILYAIAFGIAMPATALVARRAGEGHREEAAKAGAQAIWLGLGVGLVMATTALLASELLTVMGAEPAVVRDGVTFATISLATSPMIILLFVNNAIFRGAGDAVRAMRALWLANGLNIVLDPCLIFGLGPFPELGVTGAAVATAIGRTTGVVYQLYHLGRSTAVPMKGQGAPDVSIIKQLARLSMGGTVQHLVETGSWVALTRIMATFGSAAVAGYTIAIRVVLFTLMPAWGFSNATATLVGQSLGAGNPARAERSVWLSGLYNMIFLGVIAFALMLFPSEIAHLFTDNPAVVGVAESGLFIVSFGYVFYAWQMVTQQAFNGAGDTTTPAVVNFFCFWIIQIPLAYGLAIPLGMGPAGIWITVAVCYSIAAAVSIALVRRGKWKQVAV